MPRATNPHTDLLAEADAGITWVSGAMRWAYVAIPMVTTFLGVVCVAGANSLARHAAPGAQLLWWLGLLIIFIPAAATLLFARVSRTEAVTVLVLVGMALYRDVLASQPSPARASATTRAPGE